MCVAAMLLAAILLVPVPVPASAEQASQGWPTVASTTVVTTLEAGGTRLVVPPGTRLSPEEMELRLQGESTYAFAALTRHGCQQEGNALCVSHRAITMAAPGYTDEDVDITDGHEADLDPGLYDVYLVADHEVSLRLEFRGAPEGALDVRADGEIDVLSQRLERTCPEIISDCRRFGYGSATHPVGRPGMVMVTGLAYHAGAGYRSVAPCLDPHFGGGSAAAPDPEYGCPFLPGENPAVGVGSVADFLVTGSAWHNRGLRMVTLFNNDPDGEVLAGYLGAAAGAEAAEHEAFAVWLNAGIRP